MSSAHVHEDRVGLDPRILGSLALCSAVLGGTAGQVLGALGGDGSSTGSAGPVGFVVGAAVALVLVLVVRSVSVCAAARTVVALSAVAHVRMAVLGDSLLVGSQGTLVWIVCATVVLVLTDRVAVAARRPMEGWDPPSGRGPLVRTSTLSVLAVVFLALVVAPVVLPMVSRDTAAGEGPSLDALDDGGVVIRASDSLDMTDRPELTDDIVFRVDSNRGTFWRGQTYDAWDGRRWTQTQPRRFPLVGGTDLVHAIDDIGVGGDDLVTQRVRMETTYSDVVFAAATAVRVESRRDLLQKRDGTLVTASVALGRDTTYTVVSRRNRIDEATLRAADGPVPDDVRERYAQPPVATDRVVESARGAVAGATTTYDRMRALERWMGERTEYSLDAPLSPTGVDVVDHFLFESRLGWCEQVASSLVVMARVNGIPARLVTGYVPGEVDRLTGSYVVRARDAHAWAEVWFPDVGWVPFDPTASVPLAGADDADRSFGQWVLDHWVAIVLGVAAAALVAFGVRTLVQRMRARAAARPVGWVAETDARLEALGRRAGWPRAGCETSTTFASSLARHVGEPDVASVGVAVDQALYAARGPDDALRDRIDQVLDAAEARVAARAEDHGSGTGDGPRGAGDGRTPVEAAPVT